MNKHETKRIALKEIDVDIKIITLIQWLNRHDDVFTLYSCEGGGKGRPYVCFLCFENKTLQKILSIFSEFLGYTSEQNWWITVDQNIPGWPLRYTLRLKSDSQLASLSKILEKTMPPLNPENRTMRYNG